MTSKRAAAIAAALTLGIGAAACGDHDTNPWFAAMRQERVARITPGGGKLVLDLEAEPRDAAFSKPTGAELSRAFQYRTRRSAVRGLGAALRTATASGWRVNLDRQYPTDPYFGSKRLALGEATLIVGAYKKGSRYRVTIRLEQGACAELCRLPSRR